MQSGIVGNFVFEQLDQDRKAFSGMKFADFKTKMAATDVYFTKFQKFLSNNGLDLRLIGNKAIVKRYLNAEFARQLYGEKYYYEIVLKEDAMIKAVLKKK